MVLLDPTTFVLSWHTVVVGARKVNPSLTLMLCNARIINNKTMTLQNYLVCVTETWVRQDKTVALKELPLPGSSTSLARDHCLCVWQY